MAPLTSSPASTHIECFEPCFVIAIGPSPAWNKLPRSGLCQGRGAFGRRGAVGCNGSIVCLKVGTTWHLDCKEETKKTRTGEPFRGDNSSRRRSNFSKLQPERGAGPISIFVHAGRQPKPRCSLCRVFLESFCRRKRTETLSGVVLPTVMWMHASEAPSQVPSSCCWCLGSAAQVPKPHRVFAHTIVWTKCESKTLAGPLLPFDP